jgi:hypothetical protein
MSSIDDVFEKQTSVVEKQEVGAKYSKRDFIPGSLNGYSLNEYRSLCSNYLVEKYQWPRRVANLTVRFIKNPIKDKEKKRFSDYLIGVTAGNLPKRYVEPLSELMGVERRFLTKTNLVADVGFGALGVFLMYAVPELEQSSINLLPRFYEAIGVGAGAFNSIVTANVAMRAVQFPIRTFYHLKHDVHLPAPTMIINPFFVESLPGAYLFGYDWYKKSKNILKNNDFSFRRLFSNGKSVS